MNEGTAGEDAETSGDDVFFVDAPADTPAGDSGSTGHHRWRLRRRRAELITSQHRTAGQNLHRRKVIYLTLQLLRLPLIALALVTYLVWENWWLAAIVFVVSVPLPWVAVVIANEKGEVADKRERNVYKPAAVREHRRAVAAEHAGQLGQAQRRELGAGPADPGSPDTGRAAEEQHPTIDDPNWRPSK
ncbi:DUF3099 domain-containing protein [Corynebacterium frankenforstense]|uniref:DUF3099 domain-containing protein n=1 Tax=Corynebacterium frankenforstense TaxID=1230998 RepID=UPI000951ADA6|nr:DUF3099 domain-containing protein [Corynebacterium frankenforstense]